VAILARTHECSTIPKSEFHAKAQRKSLFFAPLRALRETSFSSNDGITHILRTISSRTDLCITARIPAWEPFSFKLLLGRSSGSWSFKNTIPKRELGNEQNVAAAEKLAVFRTTAFAAERIKRANPGDMLSILELAGTDEIEIECHDLIELHSSMHRRKT